MFDNNTVGKYMNLNNGGSVVAGPNHGWNVGPVNRPWTYAPNYSPYHGGYNRTYVPTWAPSYSPSVNYHPSYSSPIYAPSTLYAPYWGIPSYASGPYEHWGPDDWEPGHCCTSVVHHCHGSGGGGSRRRRPTRAMMDPFMTGFDPLGPWGLLGDPWGSLEFWDPWRV